MPTKIQAFLTLILCFSSFYLEGLICLFTHTQNSRKIMTNFENFDTKYIILYFIIFNIIFQLLTVKYVYLINIGLYLEVVVPYYMVTYGFVAFPFNTVLVVCSSILKY